jgi:hypothetical protein
VRVVCSNSSTCCSSAASCCYTLPTSTCCSSTAAATTSSTSSARQQQLQDLLLEVKAAAAADLAVAGACSSVTLDSLPGASDTQRLPVCYVNETVVCYLLPLLFGKVIFNLQGSIQPNKADVGGLNKQHIT